MKEAGAGDFAEDSTRVLWQTLGQLCPGLAVEPPLGVEKVGAIEYTPHHVPLGEAQGVIPNRVEHSPVELAFCLGASGTGRPMPQLLRPGSRRGPLGQLLQRGIAQGIVQPDGAKPAVPFRMRHSHQLRPAGRKLGHSLDVVQPSRCDDGPLG